MATVISGSFELGVPELAVLGCCGAVVIGAIAVVVFALSGKDRKDE
jgi:hypothetical protein